MTHSTTNQLDRFVRSLPIVILPAWRSDSADDAGIIRICLAGLDSHRILCKFLPRHVGESIKRRFNAVVASCKFETDLSDNHRLPFRGQ